MTTIRWQYMLYLDIFGLNIFNEFWWYCSICIISYICQEIRKIERDLFSAYWPWCELKWCENAVGFKTETRVAMVGIFSWNMCLDVPGHSWSLAPRCPLAVPGTAAKCVALCSTWWVHLQRATWQVHGRFIFSRVRSEGFSFCFGGLGWSGVGTRSLDAAAVRNRPQPFAMRSLWLRECCTSGHFWRFKTLCNVVSRGRCGTSWHPDMFHDGARGGGGARQKGKGETHRNPRTGKNQNSNSTQGERTQARRRQPGGIIRKQGKFSADLTNPGTRRHRQTKNQ